MPCISCKGGSTITKEPFWGIGMASSKWLKSPGGSDSYRLKNTWNDGIPYANSERMIGWESPKTPQHPSRQRPKWRLMAWKICGSIRRRAASHNLPAVAIHVQQIFVWEKHQGNVGTQDGQNKKTCSSERPVFEAKLCFWTMARTIPSQGFHPKSQTVCFSCISYTKHTTWHTSPVNMTFLEAFACFIGNGPFHWFPTNKLRETWNKRSSSISWMAANQVWGDQGANMIRAQRI